MFWSYLAPLRCIIVAKVVTLALVVVITTTSGARPVGESGAAFIARTLSNSPMSLDSHVHARLTDCSLVIDQAGSLEENS